MNGITPWCSEACENNQSTFVSKAVRCSTAFLYFLPILIVGLLFLSLQVFKGNSIMRATTQNSKDQRQP